MRRPPAEEGGGGNTFCWLKVLLVGLWSTLLVAAVRMFSGSPNTAPRDAPPKLMTLGKPQTPESCDAFQRTLRLQGANTPGERGVVGPVVLGGSVEGAVLAVRSVVQALGVSVGAPPHGGMLKQPNRRNDWHWEHLLRAAGSFPAERWNLKFDKSRVGSPKLAAVQVTDTLDGLCKNAMALASVTQQSMARRDDSKEHGQFRSWGWHDIDAMFSLPLVVAATSRSPGFRYLHVVQDPRDTLLDRDTGMQRNRTSHAAYSRLCVRRNAELWPFCGVNHCNARRVRQKGEPVHRASATELAAEKTSRACLAQRFQFWAATNWEVVRWATRQLGPRFMLLRVEDLVDHESRAATIQRIVDFLAGDVAAHADSAVRGRAWRSFDAHHHALLFGRAWSPAIRDKIRSDVAYASPWALGVLGTLGYNITGLGLAQDLPGKDRWKASGRFDE